MFHMVRLDVKLAARCKITQMPDCHMFWLWKIDLALAGEESEALDLVGEAAGELRRSDVLLCLAVVQRWYLFVVHEELDLIKNFKRFLLSRQDRLLSKIELV